MRISLWTTAALAVALSLLLAGGISDSKAQSQGEGEIIELGSIQDGFGFGSSVVTPPDGFILHYGLFEDTGEGGGIPLATIYEGLVIPPSDLTQTFDLFPADDPDFDAVASALITGAPAGTVFGVCVGFSDCSAGGSGEALAISVPVGAVIDHFSLEVPPFSIVGSAPGFFQISPATSQFKLSAFGTIGDFIDSDGDGIADDADNCPDDANPDQADGDGDGLGDACDPDDDNDGLPDGDEVNLFGTDPLNPDTDRDGLTDSEELFLFATDPLNPDTDGDGLTDGLEVKTYATQPLNPDSDMDGLTDGQEVESFGTDPLNPDSDFDGMPDGYEVEHECLAPTSSDGLIDADSDGLANVDEYALGTLPCSPDTDSDGLPDGVEIFGLGPFGTDPLNPDSDGDGDLDGADNCPKAFYEETGQPGFNPGQEDNDSDGLGNVCDLDDDNDGTPDAGDDFPLDPSEDTDTDGDGVGDNADTDDDNDGQSDADEVACGSDHRDNTSLSPDTDSDGLPDCVDGDDDNDRVADADDSCPLTSTEGFDADGDGCRDTLQGLVAFVSGLEDVPDSVRKALLRKTADIRHLFCDVGNTGGTVKKSQELVSYISAQTGKKILQNTADLLTSYVTNLTEQIRAGQDVCTSP